MSEQPWPFPDPQNAAALTLRDVMEGRSSILLVTHDADDGCWQFHDGRENPTLGEAVIAALGEVYSVDPTIAALADLPRGWRAWREAPDQPWQREQMAPEEDE